MKELYVNTAISILASKYTLKRERELGQKYSAQVDSADPRRHELTDENPRTRHKLPPCKLFGSKRP